MISLQLNKFIRWLNPLPCIGGLEITDSTVRYLVISKNGKTKSTSLRLSVGILRDGQVQDQTAFVNALAKLRRKIICKQVIVSISATNVYTQIFNLPLLPKSKIEEAARLNLKMISPIDIKKSYYDWQLVGEEKTNGSKLDFIGSFVDSKIIDDLTAGLQNAGFIVAAIEPIPLSLARALTHVPVLDLTKSYLSFNLSSEGLDFFILKNSNLYFSYFIPWQVLGQGKGSVSLEIMKSTIVTEIRRILHFYSSRWGEIIKNLILINVSSNKEIVTAIKSEFEGINIHEIGVTAAQGAALRGLIPRSKDIFISLTSVGTEERFIQSQTREFVHFWRNIILAVLASIVFIYGFFDFILIRYLNSLNNTIRTMPLNIQFNNKGIKDFNLLVDKAIKAKEQSLNWSPLFRLLRSLASKTITLTQVQLQQNDLAVSVSGETTSERAVINFKNILINYDNFTDVFLPLTAIQVGADGRAKFTIKFKLKKWPQP